MAKAMQVFVMMVKLEGVVLDKSLVFGQDKGLDPQCQGHDQGLDPQGQGQEQGYDPHSQGQDQGLDPQDQGQDQGVDLQGQGQDQELQFCPQGQPRTRAKDINTDWRRGGGVDVGHGVGDITAGDVATSRARQ